MNVKSYTCTHTHTHTHQFLDALTKQCDDVLYTRVQSVRHVRLMSKYLFVTSLDSFLFNALRIPCYFYYSIRPQRHYITVEVAYLFIYSNNLLFYSSCPVRVPPYFKELQMTAIVRLVQGRVS